MLFIDMKFNPFVVNRYAEVRIDGYAVSAERYLPKGRLRLALDEGSHEMQLFIDKRSADIHVLPKDPLKFTFNTKRGKKYLISIDKKASFTKCVFTLSYKGWNKDESAKFPRQFP